MGFLGAQMGPNAKPHSFGVARDPFTPDAGNRSDLKWVFEVCKTHTSKPVTQDLFRSGLPGAHLLGGRSTGMGDDICEISSPNSRPCASKVRIYFRTLRKYHLDRNFFGVLYQKMRQSGYKLARVWRFTQVGEPPPQNVRGEGRDLVKTTRSVEKSEKKGGEGMFTYLIGLNLVLSGVQMALVIISPC